MMYANQIDTFVDDVLNNLYLRTSADPIFTKLIGGKVTNLVEYQEEINSFIRSFVEGLDITPVVKLISGKDNLILVIDVIKRYVAYYFFLFIGYYYPGTLKEYRNTIIQYSKMQEMSRDIIRDFFDSSNNYQLISFYKIVKDISQLLLMTDLQLKTINRESVKEALSLIQSLGKTYVDSYLLEIKQGASSESGETQVTINVHGLLKTLVFRQIYYFQDRDKIFNILNEIQEDQSEYIYIDVVVNDDIVVGYETFRNALGGRRDAAYLSRIFYDLYQESSRKIVPPSPDAKTLQMITLPFIVPIVDDFLRYHRDTEHLDSDIEQDRLLTSFNNNSRNIQMALLQQQKKKKEVTRAQMIVSKLDVISDFYTPSVRKNERLLKELLRIFQNPYAHRKAVLYNHEDEVNVVNKIRNQGGRVIEGNEYYEELREIINNAYFNFKDFRTVGTPVGLTGNLPIKTLRYANIEFQSSYPSLFLDLRSGAPDTMINLVGLALGPVNGELIDCSTKDSLVDIRTITISHQTKDKVSTIHTKNGYQMYLSAIKTFYIDPITVAVEEQIGSDRMRIRLVRRMEQVLELNPGIADKVIYWEYDLAHDSFKSEGYENLQEGNFVKYIRYMNASLSDTLRRFLLRKLHRLIISAQRLPLYLVEELLEMFQKEYLLDLSESQKRETISKYYLQRLKVPEEQVMLLPPSHSRLPSYQEVPVRKPLVIKIDTRDPRHLRPYLRIEIHSKEGKENLNRPRKICQHEEDWKEAYALREGNINLFNEAVTEFTDKYSVITLRKEFICRICGEVLPIKDYVEDGSFDDAAQKFVSSYVPIDIPLEEYTEYAKYPETIKRLNSLTSRLGLSTGINNYVGNDRQARETRQALVKIVLDIILEHNSTNIKKNVSDEARAKYYQEKYGISEKSDSVYFFELNDSIFKTDASMTPIERNVRDLKHNNVLLYLILFYICDLNGPQILSIPTNKHTNIYHYLSRGISIFRNMRIKTNTSDLETVPITDFPVLCYLLFIISYHLVDSRLWIYPGTETRRLMPQLQHVIITSFLDIFNSISTDANRKRDSYVYSLSSSRMYQSLGKMMRNNLVLDALKNAQRQWSTEGPAGPIVKQDPNLRATDANRAEYLKPIKLVNFRPSYGIIFTGMEGILRPPLEHYNSETCCPNGHFQRFKLGGDTLESVDCPDAPENPNLLDSVYYYRMSLLARRKCLTGQPHDYEETPEGQVCRLCHKTPSTTYSHADLDTLQKNLLKIQEDSYELTTEQKMKYNQEMTSQDENHRSLYQEVVSSYQTSYDKKATLGNVIDTLLNPIETLIGKDTNVEPDRIPIYVKSNVYLIDHNYEGGILPEPIVINQASEKIMTKENHPFFGTDVYYYRDNSSGTEVYYHAVNLSYLGYREKHREYVRTPYTNLKLRIVLSIRNRLEELGYPSSYIDMSRYIKEYGEIKDSPTVEMSPKKYARILDSIVQDHITKVKSSINKFISIILKTINDTEPLEEESRSYQMVASASLIVAKHRKQIQEVLKPPSTPAGGSEYFRDWQKISDEFEYQPIDWSNTVTGMELKRFVSAKTINYYDITSRVLFHYLVRELQQIYQQVDDESGRITFAQLIFDITNHVYLSYNTDITSNDLLRFRYIIDRSPFMIDTTRKGQGISRAEPEPDETEAVQENVEEVELEDGYSAEDLKYESEALDMEVITYGDADVDVDQERDD